MRKIGGSILLLGLVMAVAACGGGSSGGISGDRTPPGLVLIDVSVAGFDGVPLNEIIVFEFSADLDPDTVRPDTMQIREGPNYGKQVPGFYRVDGNLVEFYPRIPVLADLSDSGLQAGKPYRVTLPGSPKVATVRSFANEHLPKKTVEVFQTALTGSTNLFIDNFLDPLPPRILFVNPPDGANEVPADSEITLTFNRRPLHPATVSNSNIRLWMEERQGSPVNRPVSISPVLTQSHDSVQVVIRPTYPLADEATYRMEVDRRVQDLVGNDVVPPNGMSTFVARFSVRDEPFRTSELMLTFNEYEKQTVCDTDQTTASWNEAVDDALAALFTVAGGNSQAGDLTPTTNQTFTPDDFARGVEVVNEGGQDTHVYNFRVIDIPSNVTVRFQQPPGGPNLPVKLLSLKPIRVDGTITVAGGGGGTPKQTQYSNTKKKTAAGGAAGVGGGKGADTFNGTKIQNRTGEHGEDVLYGGEGGRGGKTGSSTAYNMGGGGGGGGSRTAGKDGKRGGGQSNGWDGKGGKGGRDAASRGYPLNLERVPNVGGAGGGAGGGGGYPYYGWQFSQSSGGGGGGAIGLQSAGSVTVGVGGMILAAGGFGGKIPSASAYYYGGGGGGGGGGSILLRGTSYIEFEGGTLDVAGGAGAPYTWTYTYYKGGEGGDGGTGYIRIEGGEDENSPGKPVIKGISKATMTYGPVSQGIFAPRGGGAPSVAVTLWLNLGVFDPQMIKPAATDIVATLFNDTMQIEVQMAVEDPAALGNPNLSDLDISDFDGDGETDDSLNQATLSDWVSIQNIEDVNGWGYQFIRVRITFQLDANQTVDDPLPNLDELHLPFRF